MQGSEQVFRQVSGPVLTQVSEMVSERVEQTENDMVNGFRDKMNQMKSTAGVVLKRMLTLSSVQLSYIVGPEEAGSTICGQEEESVSIPDPTATTGNVNTRKLIFSSTLVRKLQWNVHLCVLVCIPSMF